MQRFTKLVVLDNIAMFPAEKARLHSLAEEVVWLAHELPGTGRGESAPADQYCVLPGRDLAELAAVLGDADAVITCWTPLGPEALDTSPKLRYVGLWTNLWRHRVDPKDAIARAIHVDYLPDYGTIVVPEYVFAGLLQMARRPHFQHQATRRGSWSYELLKTGRRRVQNLEDVEEWSLAGKKLGVVGMGRIGSRVAELGTAFGMEVAYYSRTRKQASEDRGITYYALEDLCRWADIITIHVSPEVTGLIQESHLALLKDKTIVVNTASGVAIDQTALVSEVCSGRLRAFLDVYENLPPRKELKDLPNVLFSYRAAWFTRDSVELKGRLLLDRMEAFLRGQKHDGCATEEFSGAPGHAGS